MDELIIKKTSLEGVLKIFPSTNFLDFRGSYVELYNKVLFNRAGINIEFIQDDISTSGKGVLRGIHGDTKTWKLVSCLSGSFFLVVVDNDSDSKEFKKWESFELSDKNREMILIPPKFGNGHLVMTETAVFYYKQSTNYDRNGQFTIKWNSPELGIKWPIQNPILSSRDSGS